MGIEWSTYVEDEKDRTHFFQHIECLTEKVIAIIGKDNAKIDFLTKPLKLSSIEQDFLLSGF